MSWGGAGALYVEVHAGPFMNFCKKEEGGLGAAVSTLTNTVVSSSTQTRPVMSCREKVIWLKGNERKE